MHAYAPWRRCAPFLLLLAAAAYARQAEEFRLPDGTTLAIQLEQSVRADRARTGDEVRAKLLAPVLMRGAVAIPAGAKILGVVVEARPLTAEQPSRLLLRFHHAQWRKRTLLLSAFMTRQLVVKRTFSTESRQFCPPVERFAAPQPSPSQQQQPSPQPPQQPKSPPPPVYTPPPPPSPAPRINSGSDLCHDPFGVRRDDAYRVTFTSPSISGVNLLRLDSPEGGTVLESTKKNITLKKGMMLEIRHSAH